MAPGRNTRCHYIYTAMASVDRKRSGVCTSTTCGHHSVCKMGVGQERKREKAGPEKCFYRAGGNFPQIGG